MMNIQMLLMLVMAAVSMVQSKNVTLQISGGSVNNHQLLCSANKRIQLNSYRYRPRNGGLSVILFPERLFVTCSWRQKCTLSRSLVQAITRNTSNGHLYINHGCPNVYSAKDLCNTDVYRNGSLNLLIDSSHQFRTMSVEVNKRSCFCNVSGIFQLKVKDVRLTDFEAHTCPSVLVFACKSYNTCDRARSNCTQSGLFNKVVSTDANNGIIYMAGVSSLMSPSLIWIQILHKNRNWYSVSCYDTASLVPTSQTIIQPTPTTIETSPKINASVVETSPTVTESVSEVIATTTESTATEIKPNASAGTVTMPSSHEQTELSGTPSSRKKKGDTHDNSPPAGTVAVPIVVGCVVITAVVVVVIYCKKRRKKQDFDSTRMSNPAYEASNKEINTLGEVPATRTSLNNDEVPASGEEDHYMDVADDERYNKPTADIDNEYNKIQFKSRPIPVDEHYGHINQTNNTKHQDYDRIKGMKITEFTPYSNGYAQGIQYTENGTINKNTTDHNITKENSDDVSMTYDHLGQTDKTPTQATDDQDTNYSHIFSRSNRPVGKEQLNNDCMMLKNDKSSFETNDEASNMNHEYFSLEPNGERPDDQRLNKDDGGEGNDHQYFVLEPQSPES